MAIDAAAWRARLGWMGTLLALGVSAWAMTFVVETLLPLALLYGLVGFFLYQKRTLLTSFCLPAGGSAAPGLPLCAAAQSMDE